MKHNIKNNELDITINAKGGELWSIKKDNIEYLWQGDEKSWKSRASNIFPYVGRTTNGIYTYKGEKYSLGTHGFARHSEFIANKISDEKIEFVLDRSEKEHNDYASYPFCFIFSIIYEIKENTLFITYKVENKDDKMMYFGLGGHPGFITPLEDGLKLTDYYIEFEKEAKPNNYYVNLDTCLIDYKERYPLEDDKILRLKSSLFDKDALIFDNMDKSLCLKSDKSSRSVKVSFSDMDYLGIWQSPKLAPNFICIEPWTSLPSRHGITEDLETQENLISLNIGKTYENTWSISLS